MSITISSHNPIRIGTLKIPPEGLTEIVANFADSSVGCVSSVDRILGQDGKPCGEGFYVRYEWG